MKSFSFSACFLFLSLLETLVFLKEPMYFGKIPNKWARLYLLNFRLNICIDNDSSRASSNCSTCNILSSGTVLIRVGIVTSEAFSLTEMIWFRLHSSWITVDDIKFRSQAKHVQLSSKLYSLLSHEISSLFQRSLYYIQAGKLSLRTVLSCFSRKVTSKNLRQYHASWKVISADNQQKFDSSTNSALYMLNDWL